MNSDRFRRRTIALISAYAMALQTLFAAFVPPALAAQDAALALLCSHDADGPGQPAARHDLPCVALCAAMGHGVAGPVPPDVAAAFAARRASAAIGPVDQWVPPRIVLTRIHAPRGPPLA